MRASQQGQVLVLGLLFALLLGLVLQRFFYVGQVNQQVVRQRHALDAATYSGALLQAQVLNYTAYMQRAYIGHQLAMAHLITMASWAHFAGTEAVRVGLRNPPVSVIGMMFGPEHAIAYQSSTLAAGSTQEAGFYRALGRAFAQHDHFAQQVMSPSLLQIRQQLPLWREQVMWQVLQDNYPEFDPNQLKQQMQLHIYDESWDGYTVWEPGLSLRPWLQELMKHYAFLQPRNHTIKNTWVVDPRCPHKRHELRRRGQTQLDEKGLWHAEDTQSYHALRSNRWIGCYHREYPMGWAWLPSHAQKTSASEVIDDPPEDFSQQDFWRWVEQNTNWNIFSGNSNPLAASWAKKDQKTWQGRGLAAWLRVQEKPSSLAFSTELIWQSPYGVAMSSRSGAESYFVRPHPRQDRKKEKSNLLHAFWQARLQHRHWLTPLGIGGKDE
ncbi:hypothetical protein [Paenalcaligenes sp.]|uniref:hypothetical protein n=1 Tax=Paenalcaligenes sp. TaxID=1966342 RepID=UPI00262BE337|nr:hypothetical protein [Paenalcaligenes sp.]